MTTRRAKTAAALRVAVRPNPDRRYVALRFAKVTGFSLLGWGLASAGAGVVAAAGVLHLDQGVITFLGFVVGGIAAALAKSWQIAQRMTAMGLEPPLGLAVGPPMISSPVPASSSTESPPVSNS